MPYSLTEMFKIFGGTPRARYYVPIFMKRAKRPDLSRQTGETQAAYTGRIVAATKEGDGNPFLECMARAALTYSGLEDGATFLLDLISKVVGEISDVELYSAGSGKARFRLVRPRFHIR